MAHWGWHWKIKLKHTRKSLCLNHFTIDSFELFKNKIGVELCRNRVAFEFLAYQLKATLLEDHYHVEYDGGSYNIPIEKQPCNYGGFRYFFHCPKCDKRMRILYCKKGKFLCRKCLNLCYFTQILKPSTRCLIMEGKIKEKLQSMAGDIDKKPPWMKQKTFQRFKMRAAYYDAKYFLEGNKELRQWYGPRVEEWLLDEKQQLLECFFSNLKLDREKLHVELREPFKTIATVQDQHVWRPLRDSFLNCKVKFDFSFQRIETLFSKLNLFS